MNDFITKTLGVETVNEGRFSDNDLNYYEIILNKDTLALDKLDLSKRRKKSYRGMMGFFNINQ